jgi:hypothetical protein
MEKTEIFGRLIQMIDPGEVIMFEDVTVSGGFLFINEDFMLKAFKKFKIKHYEVSLGGKAYCYLENNDDIRYIVGIFYSKHWKEYVRPVITMLYKRTKTTWKSVKVVLKMCESEAESKWKE